MLAASIYNSNSANETGSVASISTKTTVIGLCTAEIVGTAAANMTIKVQGKLFSSSDADVDTGWVDIVEFSNISDNSIVGRAIGVFTFLRVVVANNDNNAQIQVAVGYN